MSWFEWGNLCLERGDFVMAVDKFTQARQVAQSRQSILFHTLALNNLAYATLLTGAIAAARAQIDEALALAETYALRSVQYYLLSTAGEIALAGGKLELATERFEQALVLAEKYDNSTFVANLQAHLGRVAHAQGQEARARQL
ncbi:MAG: hypothetical protein R2932_37430 [Caldilineaceae bacterium]